MTELDTEQRMVVLPRDAGNVGEAYGRHSEKPLLAIAVPEQRVPGKTTQLEFVDTPDKAQFSDDAEFAALLTEEDGSPVHGKEVIFELATTEGTRTFSGITGDDGIARTSATLTERPGEAHLTARFVGDDDYLGNTDTMPFVIEKEDSLITLEILGKGSKRELLATLRDLDSAVAIAGRAVEFSADTTEICRPAPPTDASGQAGCDPPPRFQSGHHTYEATFSGDDYYLDSGAQGTT
ncbi:MAG: hypothetical protein ACRDQ2_14345 [Gaiellales bacterium]